GSPESAIFQGAIQWRRLQIRPGLEVDERHPILGAGTRVQRADLSAIAEPLAQLDRQRERAVAAPVGHADALSEGRYAPAGRRDPRRTDRTVQRAVPLSLRHADRRRQIRGAIVPLVSGARVQQVYGTYDIPREP